MIKQRIRYVVFNGLFLALLWSVVHFQSANLGRVVMFLIWVGVPVMWLVSSVVFAVGLAKPEIFPIEKFKRSFPGWVDFIYDLCVACFCVWIGWKWTAALYITQQIPIFLAYDVLPECIKEARKKDQNLNAGVHQAFSDAGIKRN